MEKSGPYFTSVLHMYIIITYLYCARANQIFWGQGYPPVKFGPFLNLPLRVTPNPYIKYLYYNIIILLFFMQKIILFRGWTRYFISYGNTQFIHSCFCIYIKYHENHTQVLTGGTLYLLVENFVT